MADLIPKYLDVDYSTLVARLKDVLKVDATFQDYDFEGANATLLMELVAYHGALDTYFLNRIAKNMFMDTADVYECVHMQARLRGYNAMGYRSSSTDLTISISASAGLSNDDTIYIPAWTTFKCSAALDATTGSPIYFTNPEDLTLSAITLTNNIYTFNLSVREGRPVTYTYKGTDVIDGKFYLPFYNFDYGDNLESGGVYLEVQVGEEIWNRVPDFYDEISGLTGVTDTVYMFRYDKYQHYLLEFSPARQLPLVDDTIVVTILKTIGSRGDVGASSIDTIPTVNFIINRTTGAVLANKAGNLTYIMCTNAVASTGGADPEVINDVKDSSTSTMHSQLRNVTARDYIGHLESRADVVCANVWGEQEIAPSGSTLEYNKVYISAIPDVWGTGTISTSASDSLDGVFDPIAYADSWKTTLSTYLEPRKMLCAYEQYSLPEIIWFSYDIGLRIKRTYNFDTVKVDVLNKLIYYFDPTQREFHETISFANIQEYIIDPTKVSLTNSFSLVKGIQTIIVRKQSVINYGVYEPNTVGDYPKYYESSSTYAGDNKLRNVTLGFNQFPMLYANGCNILLED